MPLSVIILIAVFVLIAARRIGNIYLKIWQIMLLGAIAVLATEQISINDAIKAIDIDVMLFLFGMFIVGQALENSGFLSHLSYNVFKRARTVEKLMLYILLGIGVASAFLMNDTLAIIGTPVVLHLARKHNISSKLLLLTLAYAVTIGSVMSPIGNPQNLLIALSGNFINPFLSFFGYLAVPTLINLIATLIVLKFFYRKEFHNCDLNHSEEPIKDPRLARLSKISLLTIIVLVIIKIATAFWGSTIHYRLTYIALLAALPIVIFSPKRFAILKKIDWQTLIFFASMFVLMGAIWQGRFLQDMLEKANLDITGVSVILISSVFLSQLISNLPLVALLTPALIHAHASNGELIALAAGSSIAGNLFILGAASNVIIIQNAEKTAGETLTFWEFARAGIPVTALNIIIYWLFFFIVGA
jgi:Na+/H+ antiporter NhaD/arsenite permease-like protein